jgi:hypothetical protein
MNAPIDRSETALRAWLELGPDRGRPEAVERALAATRRVPQRPGWTYPERWLPVNRALLAAAAALIVVVGAAAIIPRLVSEVGPPGPSSSAPTSTPTPARTAEPTQDARRVPDELFHVWVGAPHGFPGHAKVDVLTFEFYFGQLLVHANFGPDLFDSPIKVTGANALELTGLSNGCAVGLVGHYTWSLSPGGTLLHMAVGDDACAARSAALAGDWHAANCKGESELCWGDLEAGTYPTLFYGPRLDPEVRPKPDYGGVTFTVPSGWAVGGDHTSDFRLLRSSDYEREPATGPTSQPTEIEGWIRPAANVQGGACKPSADPGVGRTADALTTWLHGLPGLVTGPIGEITIDGHPGRWIDVSVDQKVVGACGGNFPDIPLITEAVGRAGPVGGDPYLVSISGYTRMRLIFVDIGSSGHLGSSMTAMVLVVAPTSIDFDAFIDDAMPIVQSFHFK